MEKIFPDLWRKSRYNREKPTVMSVFRVDDGIVFVHRDTGLRVKDKAVMIATKLSPAEALALAERLREEARNLILNWEEEKKPPEEEVQVEEKQEVITLEV